MDKKRCVLVVDDEPDIVSVLGLRLKTAGYDVVTASHGLEALTILRTRLPDVIITDVLMPEMDGFAFYKELKRNKILADIPVIILTARGKMEDTFEAAGVDEFLVKPFEAQVLLEKVDRLVSRSEQAALIAAGKKVLLAGADNDVLENMSRQLTRAGCHVDLVTTGPQIISKSVMFLPALMVIEAQMEGMSSSEIVTVVRKLPQVEKIPVLIYSFYRIEDLGSEDVRQKALSVDSAVARCIEAGATEYLGRFNEHTFLRQVSAHL